MCSNTFYEQCDYTVKCMSLVMYYVIIIMYSVVTTSKSRLYCQSALGLGGRPRRKVAFRQRSVAIIQAVADPGTNLTGALHSNFGRGGCGGHG